MNCSTLADKSKQLTKPNMHENNRYLWLHDPRNQDHQNSQKKRRAREKSKRPSKFIHMPRSENQNVFSSFLHYNS